MHLFVDISSHGFGHLAITAPVLNTLAEIEPGLQLTVRSGLPPSKLAERIHAPYRLIEGCTDFGYKMFDATRVDLAASADAYRQAHADWPARVAAESAFLSSLQADLVLTNVSYLPLAAAAAAGIPSASLCSLNWADLFSHFFGNEAWADPIHRQMESAYNAAQAFLRVTPGMPMPGLGNLRPIGPIAAIGKAHDLGLGDSKAVLVTMGGIAHDVPVDRWPRLPGVRWLVPAAWQCRHPDAITIESFGLSFTDLLCSVDAVLTKPGYGTFTEAACNGTPVIYQPRSDWPEQDCLIDWLAQHGRCAGINADQFTQGELAGALASLETQEVKGRPPADGIGSAARHLSGLARQ